MKQKIMESGSDTTLGSAKDAETPLERLEYGPLDLETQEIRFLILKPHHGDTEKVVECSISTSPLQNCEPYTAVVNTRGNPFANVEIQVDGCYKVVTRNILYFLIHIRDPERAQRFWFRDVCVDHTSPAERAAYWNPEWMETMSRHASKVLDLSEITTALWGQGKLPRPFKPRPKEWIAEPRKSTAPTHHPMAIGSWSGPDAPPLPHRYLPLDYVADEFRLVTLWKAVDPSQPLVAVFGYTPMHDDTTYHCVSYTWGHEAPEKTMLLNGQTFHIRLHLDALLRAVRHHEYKITLWIDAICIDQSSLGERSRQIPRMLEIYEASDVTLCWVGEADETSAVAFALIRELKSPKLRRHPDDNAWMVRDEETFPLSLAALYRFFMRPYFRRIWVIQEVAVSSAPLLLCGKDQLSWHEIDMAAYHLVDVLHRDLTMAEQMMSADTLLGSVSDRELSFVRRLAYFRHLESRGQHDALGQYWGNFRKDSPGILDAMVLGRDFQSTCPHDKIFALWSLAQDIRDVSFTMDYATSLAETYVGFAKVVAERTGSLDVICAAEPEVAGELRGGVPSWCPDWSTPASVSSMVRHEHVPNSFMTAVQDFSGPIYSAAGSGDLTRRFHFEGDVLHCAGVILDTVRIVGRYQAELGVSRQELFAEWMSIAIAECGLTESSPQELMSAFWSMLAGDVTGVWAAERVRDDGEQGTLFFVTPVDERERPLRHQPFGMHDDVYRIATRGRRLIVTTNGYMGLAPHYVEAGQKIALLNACTTPVLLRENQDGTFQFRGSCFVQGWMEGEMLERYGGTAEEAWANIEAERTCIKIV